MTFLLGTLAAGAVSLLLVLCGYAVSGFLAHETRLNRMALASVLGLAWAVFFASVAGAFVPLTGVMAWLAWAPAAMTLLVPGIRQQLTADLSAAFKSSASIGAIAGIVVLWVALLLPFLIYPDLAFFDGKANHDNFFWCIGADYLQHHDYLGAPAKNPDHPLFNLIWSFCGWHPAWARMGTEGLVAIVSATFGLTPVRLYNFIAGALSIPWLLLSFAIAREFGLPQLNRTWLALVFFCQPVFFFFVANGNIPNLLGALFSGGLWLTALLVAGRRSPLWCLALTGVFLVHGTLASYPEIFVFTLAPVGLLAVRQLVAPNLRESRLFVWLLIGLIAGLGLNPITTIRLWSGIQNSIVQAHNDSAWANIFDRITFAGYIPGLITLGVPTVRLYGTIGGLIASAAVLASIYFLLRNSKHRSSLFMSMSGFAALLIYTVATSFGYGWQKSVQFSGIHFAVLFPFLLAGTIQNFCRESPRRFLPLLTLLTTAGLMLHGMIGITAENLKSAGIKGLTNSALALHYQVEKELPNRAIQVDAATFRAAFFQSMWSAKLFPKNPLRFIQGDDPKEAGYLRESVKTIDSRQTDRNAVYYIARDWVDAFDYATPPLISDRVGALVSRHNFVTGLAGFYRATGVPQLAKPEFSLTVHPYADGWLEFVLAPKNPMEGTQLHATITSSEGVRTIDAPMKDGLMLVHFPLRSDSDNTIVAKISGAPMIESGTEESDYPFRVVSIRSGRSP